MIRSVHLWNFESHEDTLVEFSPGMNLLVGPSNSGKSSLLRGLRMVVNNDWDKDMVRMGYETCRVRVETDRGWVEAERGEKTNVWKCQENGGALQEYRKVGTGVPELATRILGMGERERGGGIKELPNFQSQLEKHYMLSEIGEKKATSNMIAVMMDNAIGLGGMEEMIKDFSSDMAKDKKWLSDKQSEIAELKTAILDESIFLDYERSVKAVSDLGGYIDDIDGKLADAGSVKDEYDEIFRRKRCNDHVLNAVSGYDDMEDCVSSVSDGIGKIGILERMADVSGRLSRSAAMASMDCDGMASLVNECEYLVEAEGVLESTVAVDRKIKGMSVKLSVDADPMDGILSFVRDMDGRISAAERMLSEARASWRKGREKEKECERLSIEMKTAEDEFGRMKDELGICPLCGRAFEDEKEM